MWWALAVFGLCALLAFVMLSLAPIGFTWAALFAFIYGVLRLKASTAGAFGAAVGIFLVVLFAVPAGSIRAVHANLAKYDRPTIAVSETIRFDGNLLVSAPPSSMDRYFHAETGEPARYTLNLLLLSGEVETITVSSYDPVDFDELRADFGPDAAKGRTFGIAATNRCQALLRSYRDDFWTVAVATPGSQEEWRNRRETLAQDCIVLADLPERFDWKVRYGVWHDAASKTENAAPFNQFGFHHIRSQYRPYRAGVRVSFAEIIGPDDEPVFRAFNPRAHALAAPLQFDRGGWVSGSSAIERAFGGITAAYEETSLNAPISREQSNLIPESLRYDFPIAL
ncbi:hypothetical protein FIU90_07460 [Erythrobacter sp. THAF29]|nr:hypothetical protein FIU90_07460 [Erythrobacter sp. THAF29]